MPARHDGATENGLARSYCDNSDNGHARGPRRHPSNCRYWLAIMRDMVLCGGWVFEVRVGRAGLRGFLLC
jgi:hypothetical protein